MKSKAFNRRLFPVALPLAGLLGVQIAMADNLYIGDGGNPAEVGSSTVKRFDADGNLLGAFEPGSGGLDGPRGVLFDGNLLVVNQNVFEKSAGEVLRFSQTGTFLGALVPASDKNAPFVPLGAALVPGQALYVANLSKSNGKTSGDVRMYDATNGNLLRILDAPLLKNKDYHPRAIVVGPDNLLYVTVRDLKKDGQGGHILRFTQQGDFVDVFITDLGGSGQLNRPEGLVFGPDGRLYVTSFRANAEDTDSIRIYDAVSGAFLDKIDLHQPDLGEARVFAQAILFGPDGRLFVPLNNTGEVRRYDVTTKNFDVFIPAGTLFQPWYLTFEKTNPATLAYEN